MIKTRLLPYVVILIHFLTAIYFYPQLPDIVATHWGSDGQPNGYSSKAFGTYFVPLLSVFMYVLLAVLPKTDPYRSNLKRFQKSYQLFSVFILGFLYYIYLLTLLWNSGYQLNIIKWLSPAFALLFYFTSSLLKTAKRNWFVGIRTPWTMANDYVWDKSHQFGSQVFKYVSMLSIGGFFYPEYAVYLWLIPILVGSIAIVIYSYTTFVQHQSVGE